MQKNMKNSMKMNTKRGLAVFAAAAALATLPGCIIVDSNGGSKLNRISSTEMDTLVNDNKLLEIGMVKSEVMPLYPGRTISLWSSTEIDGHRVEEWRVYATQKNPSTLFRRWIYFVDGKVAEFGREQVDYKKGSRVEDWAATVARY